MTPTRPALGPEAARDRAAGGRAATSDSVVPATRRSAAPMTAPLPALRLEATPDLASARAATAAEGRSVQRAGPAP